MHQQRGYPFYPIRGNGKAGVWRFEGLCKIGAGLCLASSKLKVVTDDSATTFLCVKGAAAQGLNIAEAVSAPRR
ncbi:hypothetical protein KL86DPRO_20056 [uncultured delta proteobacterium]|uniref:Uncharacterized protein n=1 Tax=uncultured delta proteobacterium TaxID=34034 RepID=A0A212JU03_9DELT|nr:hypothetical protein KL86DPRO_20056 [uncultured delta proteobacterium]